MLEPKGAQEAHSQLHPVISETHRRRGSGRRQRSKAVLELGLHAFHVSPLPSDSLMVGGTPNPGQPMSPRLSFPGRKDSRRCFPSRVPGTLLTPRKPLLGLGLSPKSSSRGGDSVGRTGGLSAWSCSDLETPSPGLPS